MDFGGFPSRQKIRGSNENSLMKSHQLLKYWLLSFWAHVVVLLYTWDLTQICNISRRFLFPILQWSKPSTLNVMLMLVPHNKRASIYLTISQQWHREKSIGQKAKSPVSTFSRAAEQRSHKVVYVLRKVCSSTVNCSYYHNISLYPQLMQMSLGTFSVDRQKQFWQM